MQKSLQVIKLIINNKNLYFITILQSSVNNVHARYKSWCAIVDANMFSKVFDL